LNELNRFCKPYPNAVAKAKVCPHKRFEQRGKYTLSYITIKNGITHEIGESDLLCV